MIFFQIFLFSTMLYDHTAFSPPKPDSVVQVTISYKTLTYPKLDSSLDASIFIFYSMY